MNATEQPREGVQPRVKVDIVRPSSGRFESWVLAGVIGLIVLASGIAVAGRQREEATQRLFDWQISSFHDLQPTDQAIYTALTAASDVLWEGHQVLLEGTPEERKNPWPKAEELTTDLWLLPPFYKDASWTQQGEVNWTLAASFSFAGSAVYFGSGGKLPGQSAYLLNLSHVHKGASYVNGATVWVHPNPNIAAPVNVTRDSLITNGWKEVVPYTGAMEVERLRGK
jgi:hypothetical protein